MSALTEAEQEALADAEWERACREHDAKRSNVSELIRPLRVALPDSVMADNDAMPDPLDRPFGQFVRPFVWRDPSTMPRRDWLYGRHLIRKFVSATFAPGGVGKSALALAEAMAMASGKPLLGPRPRGRLRVG